MIREEIIKKISELIQIVRKIHIKMAIVKPGNIHIGERVSIGRNVIFAADSPIFIGNDVMIANRVVINTATHDYHNHPLWCERVSRPIQIGNHVWIGTGAIILPGVKIHDYAVIGAGSVVTAHVPEKAIVGGNPARILQFRSEININAPIKDFRARYEDYIPETQVCKLKDIRNGETD